MTTFAIACMSGLVIVCNTSGAEIRYIPHVQMLANDVRKAEMKSFLTGQHKFRLKNYFETLTLRWFVNKQSMTSLPY